MPDIAKFYNPAGSLHETTRVGVEAGKLVCECKLSPCSHIVRVSRFLTGRVAVIPGQPKLYPEILKYTSNPTVRARIAVVLKTIADKQTAAETAAVAVAKSEVVPSVQAQTDSLQAELAKTFGQMGATSVKWVSEAGVVKHEIKTTPPKAAVVTAKAPRAKPDGFRWIDMDMDDLKAAKAAYAAEKKRQADAKAAIEANAKAAALAVKPEVTPEKPSDPALAALALSGIAIDL